MATTDETLVTPTETVQPDYGKSELNSSEVETKAPDEPEPGSLGTVDEVKPADAGSSLLNPTGLDDEVLFTDSDKAKESAANTAKPFTTGNDFYDEFLNRREQAQFVENMQSADTLWNARPDERKKYEDQYGSKAREMFDSDYQKVEGLWREKLEKEQDKITMNANYDWLFGKNDNINYDAEPVFELTNKIFNGSMRIGTLLTDKTVSDREAAVRDKAYINDQNELVQLGDNEKWYKHSKGAGLEMNSDDPRHRSKDGRQIVAFEYINYDPEYRGKAAVKAIYEGDKPTGEIMSIWDTAGNWMASNKKTAGGFLFHMLPKTCIRTGVNLTADLITGTTAIMGSVANLLDVDDSGNEFIDNMNDAASWVKARKISISEHDQKHSFTVSNALDFVANTAAQLYMGAGLFKGVNMLTKGFLSANGLLREAAALEKTGNFARAAQLRYQYEMVSGMAGRSASLLGLTLSSGDQIVQSSRAAGFSEDETAANYIAYLGAMMAANTISERMIEPYFTNAAAKPFLNDVIKENTAKVFTVGESQKSKIMAARSLVKRMAEGLKKLPSIAGHTPNSPFTEKAKAFMFRGFNEAMEEEAEFVGQAAVELGATMIARYTHKGEKDVPKFDTLLDDGYWARQLPNIVMSGFGGFLGGGLTLHLPGMGPHNNEDTFLIKGDDRSRLMRIAMSGGENEKRLFKQMEIQKKKGAMGSHLLSVKMDEKGQFYKMTDKEAEGTLSHAEAAHKAILHQYNVYKTMFGNARTTFDEIAKMDPTLINEIKEGTGHVLHNRITNLYDQRTKLLKELNPDGYIGPEAKSNKKSEGKSEEKSTPKKKEVKKEVVPEEDISKRQGVTKEPEDIEKAKEKSEEAAEQFDERVISRAQLMGTQNLDKVRDLLNVEDEIEDVLTGKAAVQQMALAVARNKGINVFSTEHQKDIFLQSKDDKGNLINSPFVKFGDKLIDALFQADANLANGHSILHQEYLNNSLAVQQFISSAITPESLRRVANETITKPNSIAIDRDTRQVEILTNSVNKLMSGIISANDFAMIVMSSRRSLGLIGPDGEVMSTKEYVKEIQELVDAQLALEQIDEASVAKFVQDNIDIIHKASLSAYIDEISTKPMRFLTGEVNLDKGQFQERIVKEIMERRPTLDQDMETYASEKQFADDKQKEVNELKSELEAKILTEAKTSAEKYDKEVEIAKLRDKIHISETEATKAQKDLKYITSVDQLIPIVGSDVIAGMSTAANRKDSVPLIQVTSEKVNQVRNIISDYFTILRNIAPVVPTVPKLGAVYNLLNEVSVDGNNLKSTTNKIISEDPSEDVELLTTLDDGTVVRSTNIVSRIQSLKDQKINPKSENPEFRNLDEAKELLNTVNLRLGQVELLKELMPHLETFAKYTRKNPSSGNNKYDAVPKFMSEYIFDSERYLYLYSKTVKTDKEAEEFDEMERRMLMLTDFENKNSVHARLTKAKEELNDLISIGEKSLDMNQRYRVYLLSVANNLNNVRNELVNDKIITIANLRVSNPKLDEAIKALAKVTDKFTDAEPEKLVAGKEALDIVLKELNSLDDATRLSIINNSYNNLFASAYESASIVISSLATSPEQFEFYYKGLLKERQDVDKNFISPTIDQEAMIRSTFSFLTDKNDVFGRVTKVPNIYAINGKNGTGKSTMAGFGIASAQKYMDTQVKTTLGNKYDPNKQYNTAIIAAPFMHQAKAMKDFAVKCGVKVQQTVFDKKGLYQYLDSAKNLDEVSVIVFDEATFIQGAADEGQAQSELDWFREKLASLNATRIVDGLPLIKMILIGDEGQGGYHTGMSRMFDEVTDTPIDFATIKGKNTAFAKVTKSKELTYAFRTLCPAITEIGDNIIEAGEAALASLFGNKKVTKIRVKHGVVGNDSKGRWAGVEVVKDVKSLYNDPELVANISKQIDQDPNFSVLIVDDNITTDMDPKQALLRLPEDAKELRDLIDKHPSNFKFRTITSVQGGEADYVLAVTNSIFPTLPATAMGDSARLARLSMVIRRARLFAKVTANPNVNIESVPNSAITILPDEEATDLINKWNDFYLSKYRNISDRKSDVGPDIKTETTKTEEAPVAENKPETSDTTEQAPFKSSEADYEEQPPIQPASDIPVNNAPNQIEIVETAIDPNITVPIPTETLITREQYDSRVAERDALAKTEPSPEKTEKLAEMNKSIRQDYEKVRTFEDLTGKAEENQVAEEIVGEGDDKQLEEIKDGKAIDELKALAQKGIILGYSRIAEGKSIEEQNKFRLLYASDIFGKQYYKTSNYNPDPIAEAEIESTMRDMIRLDKSDKDFDAILKKYTFSLVSFQTYDTASHTDVIVHQIYAKNKINGIEVPILMLPSKEIGKEGSMGAFLSSRENTIKEAHDIMKELYKKDATKSMFDDNGKFFGPVGVPLSDDVIGKINEALDKKIAVGQNKSFPNDSKSKIGRVALSAESEKYKKNKMELEHKSVGLLYMQTPIKDMKSVFQAMTAGKPLKGTIHSRDTYITLDSNNAAYYKSLPIDYFSYMKSDEMRAMDKLNRRTSGESLKEIASYVVKTPNGKLVAKVGNYFVITIKGANDRNLSFYTQGQQGTFKLFFGLDQNGKPVTATDQTRDISTDVEAANIMRMMGSSLIKEADTETIENANEYYGKLHGYDSNKLEGLDEYERLKIMSKEFLANKMIYFSDLKIPLETSKKMLEANGVQTSDVLTFTKTTVGDHQGKAFILYSYKSTDQLDLNNVDTLNKILTGFSIRKASQEQLKQFNAQLYARYGVGVIMLDSVPQSISGILARVRSEISSKESHGKDPRDINRAAAPVKSKANQRMVAFIKELTMIVHEIEAENRKAIPEGLHNLLPQMSLDSEGKPLVRIFDDKARVALKTMLTAYAESNPVEYEALFKMLTSITSDVKLGKLVRAVDGAPDLVINLLSINDPKERLEYWKDNFENKDLDADVLKALKEYGIDETHLYTATEASSKPDGVVRGKLIYDKNTGKPAILTTERNALTFVDPKVVEGAQAVFNMYNFIEYLTKLDPKVADTIADKLDSIMRNYSSEGTLRNGVMWSGRLTTTLSSALKISKIHTADVAKNYITTVKEINPPAMMISTRALINDVTGFREAQMPKTAQVVSDNLPKEKTRAEKIAEFKKKCNESVAGILLKADEIEIKTPEAVREFFLKTAVPHIEAIFSADKNLFKSDELSIIESEVEEIKNNMLEDLKKKILSDEELEDLTEQDSLIDQSQATELALEKMKATVEDEMRDIMDGNVPGKKKSNMFTALKKVIMKSIDVARLKPEEVSAYNQLLAQVDEKIKEMKEVEKAEKAKSKKTVTTPAGQSLYTTIQLHPQYEKLTPEQNAVLKKVLNAVDDGTIGFTEAEKLDIAYLEKVLKTGEYIPDEEKAFIGDKASVARLRLYARAKKNLKLNANQMSDLTSAFAMLKVIC